MESKLGTNQIELSGKDKHYHILQVCASSKRADYKVIILVFLRGEKSLCKTYTRSITENPTRLYFELAITSQFSSLHTLRIPETEAQKAMASTLVAQHFDSNVSNTSTSEVQTHA